jgi:hypothetical protein
MAMFLGGVGLLSGWARAADKAVFSGGSETEKPLLNSQKRQMLEDNLTPELRRRSSMELGPDVPVDGPNANPRGGFRSKQLFEKMDRQKNWIFERTEDLNRSSFDDESSNAEDLSPGGTTGKPKRAVERFFNRAGQTSGNGTNHSASMTGGDLGKPEEGRRASSPYEPERRIGDAGSIDLGLGRVLDQTRSPGLGTGSDDLTRISPLFPHSAVSPVTRADSTDRFDPAYQQKKRMEGFMELLRGSSAPNPISGAIDPLNAVADTTQRSLQPVTAGTARIDAGFRNDLQNPFSAANSLNRGNWSGTFGDPGVRTLGPSTLSPAVISTPEPRYSAPQPAMLPMPQRKF